MSSTYDSGYYASETIKDDCKKGGKKKKHKWKAEGSWPSVQYTCKKCGKKTYSK